MRKIHNSKETEFKKGMIPWNKGKEWSEIRGDSHPCWKGDDIGYEGIHSWVFKHFDKPQQCERCGTTTSKRFQWHNKSGTYKRDRGDWERLCAKCHAHEHKNWEKRWQKSS